MIYNLKRIKKTGCFNQSNLVTYKLIKCTNSLPFSKGNPPVEGDIYNFGVYSINSCGDYTTRETF
jgi:hypothetical protein